MRKPLARPLAVATAVALIALPLVALFIKLTAPGWLLVILLLTSIVVALVYALQIVIAITGYLTPRASFVVTGSWRSVVAAWLNGLAAIGAAFFLVDFGDSGPSYSPFTLLLGYDEVEPGFLGDLSTAISVLCIILAIASWVWLVIEWIVSLVQRARLTRAERAVIHI